jgi:hypothetical protein
MHLLFSSIRKMTVCKKLLEIRTCILQIDSLVGPRHILAYDRTLSVTGSWLDNVSLASGIFGVFQTTQNISEKTEP